MKRLTDNETAVLYRLISNRMMVVAENYVMESAEHPPFPESLADYRNEYRTLVKIAGKLGFNVAGEEFLEPTKPINQPKI